MLKPKNAFGDKYQLKKMIDNRGLAEVWEATSNKTYLNDTVALKIFPKLDKAAIKEIEEAFANQSSLQHSNLLPARYLGIYKCQPYLEMQFCSGGNAKDKIRQLNEKEVAKCLYQIALAVAYLHDNKIIHQCLKPNNILIDGDNYYCYLPDLGLSAQLRQTIIKYIDPDTESGVDISEFSTTKNNTARITPACYHAPELFEDHPTPSPASDIWALGASIYEMATGKLPFGYLGGQTQLENDVLQDLPTNYSSDLNKVIKRCLSINEKDRPTAHEIAQSTGNYLNTGNYKLPFKENSVPSYPLMFISEKPKQKSNLWIKIAAAVILAGAIVWGIIYFINKEPFTQPGIPITLVPELPVVKDTVAIKDTIISAATKAPVAIKTISPKTNKLATQPIVLPTAPIVLKEIKPQQKDNTATVLNKITSVKKDIPLKVIKHKEPKQTSDPGIPKHKDAEQKAN